MQTAGKEGKFEEKVQANEVSSLTKQTGNSFVMAFVLCYNHSVTGSSPFSPAF